MGRVDEPLVDHLSKILERKRLEVVRRASRRVDRERTPDPSRGAHALSRLRRTTGSVPSVIAEIKYQSPSAGQIRPWAAGDAVQVALGYDHAGAAAVSVLADAMGFGGSPLAVRRVAHAVHAPVLFKGFVIDPVQVDLAFDMGASMVLLLVRALTDTELNDLVDKVLALGMQPVVEAADADELTRALRTNAAIVGVNARDLRSFRVDKDAAAQLVDSIPSDRCAVFMSGVRDVEDLRSIGGGRADAVLVGEGLMRQENPGATLAHWLSEA